MVKGGTARFILITDWNEQVVCKNSLMKYHHAVTLFHDPPGSDISLGVVGLRQTADRYAGTARCMDNFVMTNINGNMGDSSTRGIEEDKIAYRQVSFGDRLADPGLLSGCTRQSLIQFLIYIAGKSGTIKSTCTCSSKYIRSTDYLAGF